MRLLLIVLSLFALLGAGTSHAQRAQDFDDYVVHFNAFNASMLSPEVAQAYDIQRSSSRGVLTITVKKVSDAHGPAVHAQVKASAMNLTGQRREVEMHEIEDDDAVYYLGEFRVHNLETYDFTVEVTPDGNAEPYTLKFRQQFYTE